MKKHLRAALCFCVAAVPIVATAQVSLPYVRTHTEARYQGDIAPNGDDIVNFPLGSLPGVAQSRSYVPVFGFAGIGRFGVPGMPDIEAGWDDADAFARGQLPGDAGAYARAGGFSPGHMPPPNNVTALANVEVYRNYLVSGAGTVPIDLAGMIEGFLYVGTNSNPSPNLDALISIDVSMEGTLYTGNLFTVTATLDQFAGLTTVGSVAGGYSLAGFDAAWADTTSTMTARIGQDSLWELSYRESFDGIANASAGEVIGLKYRIEVQANNNEGPFEIFSTADFSNSFEFGLDTSAPNSRLTEVNLLVPEPASVAALGVALVGLAARRRRRV